MSIVSVNLENLSESARAEVMRSMEQQGPARTINHLRGVKDGETFTVAGIELIKFPGKDGKTPVVARDSLFRSEFGRNNDLRSSTVIKKLVADVLPKIVEAVGEENVCAFRTDLTTLDGLKPYGAMESRISLPTLDFYRSNVEIFDKYEVDDYWWTATPESAKPHDDPDWTVCVAPSGCIGNGVYDIDYGVRPFLIFNSSIFESYEK